MDIHSHIPTDTHTGIEVVLTLFIDHHLGMVMPQAAMASITNKRKDLLRGSFYAIAWVRISSTPLSLWMKALM